MQGLLQDRGQPQAQPSARDPQAGPCQWAALGNNSYIPIAVLVPAHPHPNPHPQPHPHPCSRPHPQRGKLSPGGGCTGASVAVPGSGEGHSWKTHPWRESSAAGGPPAPGGMLMGAPAKQVALRVGDDLGLSTLPGEMCMGMPSLVKGACMWGSQLPGTCSGIGAGVTWGPCPRAVACPCPGRCSVGEDRQCSELEPCRWAAAGLWLCHFLGCAGAHHEPEGSAHPSGLPTGAVHWCRALVPRQHTSPQARADVSWGHTAPLAGLEWAPHGHWGGCG